MQRTYSRELSQKIGSKTRIEGWLHLIRDHGGIRFIMVRDKYGICQVVSSNEQEFSKLEGLQTGSVLRIEGQVKEGPTDLGCELQCETIEVLEPVTHVSPVDISKKELNVNLDTLLENRVVTLRHPQQQAIFRLYAKTVQHIREFFIAEEFVEISTPKIIATPTEGGADVFSIDYFEQKACLAQSPQFYKQMMVGVFEKVFEIGRVFRAENSNTSRHTTEVNMLDMEMGFVSGLDDVLKMTEKMLQSVSRAIWQSSIKDLQMLGATEPVIAKELPRITLDELHALMKKEEGVDHTGEKDAAPDEERFICEYAQKHWQSEAVFITDFPWSDAKFYHRRSKENPQVAERADLLFRGVEIATVPMRESNHETLLAQMKEKGLDSSDEGFRYYLDAFKYGLPQHGGFGFGVARLVEKIIGLQNVKEAELFPRDPHRLVP